ncbi:MAG: mycofactocin precursor MftA [Mycobacteriales bacterium]
MSDPTTTAVDEDVTAVEEVITEDLLVEDVSIDGMCGVY